MSITMGRIVSKFVEPWEIRVFYPLSDPCLTCQLFPHADSWGVFFRAKNPFWTFDEIKAPGGPTAFKAPLGFGMGLDGGLCYGNIAFS
jgi:hypothetical protein